jgi:hypothetical protein
MAGDADVVEKLKTGYQAIGRTYKNHIDGDIPRHDCGVGYFISRAKGRARCAMPCMGSPHEVFKTAR